MKILQQDTHLIGQCEYASIGIEQEKPAARNNENMGLLQGDMRWECGLSPDDTENMLHTPVHLEFNGRARICMEHWV